MIPLQIYHYLLILQNKLYIINIIILFYQKKTVYMYYNNKNKENIM
jgi:hypothetical protein